MKIAFPSREFDEAVAGVCHGSASDEQAQALNELLRTHVPARDEYILRLELHSRLASEPDLFVTASPGATETLPARHAIALPQNVLPFQSPPRVRDGKLTWVIALAACFALLAAGWWGLRFWGPTERKGTTSKAVAMLNRVVDARWSQRGGNPRLGAPLEPGWLRLESGLVQVVFYSGARVVIEGPIEFQIISPSEASCRRGRLTADVPPQAQGFRIGTPQMNVMDLGTTSFGLEVKDRQTELHVFKGSVELRAAAGTVKQNLQEGAGVVVESSRLPRLIAANPAAFASLFDLQRKSVAAEAQRYDQWRAASRSLNRDPSLLVHFDFENVAPADWRLRNVGYRSAAAPDATIVGCQWIEGRWPDKPALEFQSVSDRVRFSVPGEFQALTLSAWVNVKGLDREFNSLFMCDGFDPGKMHWQIRNDGVLDLGVQGPRIRDLQVFASPAVIGFNQFGQWLHLAVVLDGERRQVVHYVNGSAVSYHVMRLLPPYRLGPAELGNWNAGDIPNKPAFLIRHFSGAMDEFCLFSRALSDAEVQALYTEGKPQPDPLAP